MPASSDSQDLRRIIGISATSARKSYYPLLQRTIAELEAEIAERRQAETALRATLQRLERQEQAMVSLTSYQATGQVEGGLAMACAALAHALELTRATVWRLEGDRAIPVASSTDDLSADVPLAPALLAALAGPSPLAVADAAADPRTAGLWQDLGRQGPGGLMVSPVFHTQGRWGLLMAEHTAGPRSWFGDEIAFLGRMAEHVAFLLVVQETQRLRKLLANIVDSMPSVLITVDRHGTVTQWNRHAEAVTGRPAAAVLGRPLAEAAPHLGFCQDLACRALATRTPQELPRQARSDGAQVLYEDITVYPLVTNGMEGAVIRVDDVTERHRMEQMLIQSEKMLSVGGLAAGMAHEINNPLASILGNAQVLAARLTSTHPANLQAAVQAGVDFGALQRYLAARDVPRMLAAIQEAGRRAATLVTNMLGFSRKADDRLRPTDLAGLVRATLELAATDYDLKKHFDFRKIAIEMHADPNLPAVPCAESKIQQVILNILRNGAEAMAEKAYPPGEGPRFVIHLDQHDGFARVRIADNGPGMDEAVRARALEPFFTTKPPGKGTGLGLSVSYFIVTQEHGGRLTVESTPGQGACFTIELPLAATNENGGPKASVGDDAFVPRG